ncbi:iron complex transport system permease protein [Methylobacterium sp. PvP062]|uniref:Iron complex transport system permease protein n=1 Tax=Methylobacterium radiotolerans TaxID=31998 RepID=A0ABV2NTV2_9HYPH|nr:MULTISPECIES: iron ABC transporter permease [unclassified Methylobacterium]MBP2498317.1 iron complex transport system permease protein [Methylobacterium sp. PvP105]MBP2505701.1 iron complex transport system permease protein [Methylobacterium sp. PvP109]
MTRLLNGASGSPHEGRDLASEYGRTLRQRAAWLALAILGVGLAFLLDVATGPSLLSPDKVLRALFDPAGVTPAEAAIVREIRLPPAVTALLVGAALSLAGTEMQTVLDNPLASPFTLGLASAATFGAALCIVLGTTVPFLPTAWIVPAYAFAFAFGTALLLQALSRLRGGRDGVLLFGIALFFTFNALVALLQFAATEQALQQLVFWTMGNLARTTWSQIVILTAILAVATGLSLRSASDLTALRFGAERARTFGIDVGRLRLAAMLRISLLTAAGVAFVGTIGFVGLVGPHLARLLTGEDHRFLLPMSLCTGALLLSFASTASKLTIPGVVLPVGIVTALIGVPFFLILIARQGRHDC